MGDKSQDPFYRQEAEAGISGITPVTARSPEDSPLLLGLDSPLPPTPGPDPGSPGGARTSTLSSAASTSGCSCCGAGQLGAGLARPCWRS